MEGTGLMEKITTINVEKTYDIELLASDQYQILLGGTDELSYKIQYLQAVLEGLDPALSGSIDLTFAEKRSPSSMSGSRPSDFYHNFSNCLLT